MARYQITFTIETPEHEDTGIVLDAAEATVVDLLTNCDAVCINAENVHDGSSPSVVEVPDRQAVALARHREATKLRRRRVVQGGLGKRDAARLRDLSMGLGR